MKKIVAIITILVMVMSAVPAHAFDVSWNGWYWFFGYARADITNAEDGNTAVLAIYSDADDTLLRVARAEVSNGKANPSARIAAGEYARVFVWDENSLEPEGEYPFNVTSDGVNGKGFLFSDNQRANNQNAVGYKSLTPFTGEYTLRMNLTVEEKGDNAIMLGDSNNGELSYGTSSAILLFNGDNFTVRPGDGNGSYSADAYTLCPVEVGKSYIITITGNTDTNSYRIKIKDGENEYTSANLTARRNAEKIDTLALISNGKNTTNNSGYYEDFAFYARNIELTAEFEEVVIDYKYNGFAGLYYALKADGKYIRGNMGKLSCDYTTVKDDSAKFIPRDMGDSSYAFVCKSSNNRITVADEQNLLSAAYDVNGDSQHWVLEESESYSKTNLSYYMKNLATGEYIGVGNVSGNRVLVKTNEAGKQEIVLEPLYSESPLYLVSETEAYNALSDAQKARIEAVYESVAGDIFGRYGGHSEWTPRIRLDNAFNEILSGQSDVAAQRALLNDFLSTANNFIYSGQASYEQVSTSLPGTEGLYWTIDEGVAGTYDFWRGTMLEGVLYKLNICEADGEVQQTLNLYVQNDGTAKTNAETFKNVIVQIPYIFRTKLRTVKVRSDSANSYNGGGGDLYIRLNWSPDKNAMRSTVVHELGHIIDSNNGNWSAGGGWKNAIAMDMYTPSTYGGTNSTEDFAEFSRLYFSCYFNRDMQRGLKIIMPERYASFGRLRKNNLGGWGLWEDEYTN